jgi:UDPglucose 6-dehydrogenase
LKASIGFGGSCFQKDVLNLVYICRFYGLEEAARYWMGVIDINEWQRRRFARHIVQSMFDSVRGKRIAMFGFAFKKDTADIRETSAIPIAQLLLMDGAKLSIYDPKVSRDDIFGSLTDALKDTDGIDVSRNVERAEDAYSAAEVCTPNRFFHIIHPYHSSNF